MDKGARVNRGPIAARRGRQEALSARVPPLVIPSPAIRPTQPCSPAAPGSAIGPAVWAAAPRQLLSPPYLRARGGEASGSCASSVYRPLDFLALARVDDVQRRARDVRGSWRPRRWNPGRLRLREGKDALRSGDRGAGR